MTTMREIYSYSGMEINMKLTDRLCNDLNAKPASSIEKNPSISHIDISPEDEVFLHPRDGKFVSGKPLIRLEGNSNQQSVMDETRTHFEDEDLQEGDNTKKKRSTKSQKKIVDQQEEVLQAPDVRILCASVTVQSSQDKETPTLGHSASETIATAREQVSNLVLDIADEAVEFSDRNQLELEPSADDYSMVL